MSAKDKIEARDEPFDAVVCFKEVIPGVSAKGAQHARTVVVLGFIEELEKQPEKPVVYFYSMEMDHVDWSTLRNAIASLQVGYRVRVNQTGSADGIPTVVRFVVDTTEFAKEYLASLKKAD